MTKHDWKLIGIIALGFILGVLFAAMAIYGLHLYHTGPPPPRKW